MSQTSTSLISTPRRTSSALFSAATKASGSPALSAETFPPSPGTFRHPRFTEIVTRQSATSISSQNIRTAVINTAVLIASLVLGHSVQSLTTTLLDTSGLQFPWLDVVIPLNLIRLLLFTNIVIALRPAIPYISKKDELTDIPLTPSQRALFGLTTTPTTSTPTSAPPATGTFITPPRYRHVSGSPSTTPNSSTTTDRRSISANYSGSPLSTSRTTLGFSPSPAPSSAPFSPLLHRAVTRSSTTTGDFPDSSPSRSTSGTPNMSRSQNFLSGDRGSMATSSAFGGSVAPPATLSPSGGAKRGVPGVNYKWLYDKGLGMPGKN